MKQELAQIWAERAQAELGASRRFRNLFERLQDFGAHPNILQRVEQAEQEEDLHAFWCSKMAIQLGHATGFALPKGVSDSLTCSWKGLPEKDVLLLDVVLMGCITESLNASLLNSIYAQSDRSAAGRLLHRILKDEVKHAQIGWAYLAEQCSQRDCGFVSNYLVEMVEISVKEELFLPAPEKDDGGTYHYGVMPVSARLAQFQTTLEQVVCAGFEHFGIDASKLREWLSQQLARS